MDNLNDLPFSNDDKPFVDKGYYDYLDIDGTSIIRVRVYNDGHEEIIR